MTWRAVERSPFRCWAAWEPRARPAAAAPALDLAAARLAWPGRAGADALPAEVPPEIEVVLVPPVLAELAARRDALAEGIEQAGGVALVQRLPGEPRASRGIDLIDLTSVVLGERSLDGEVPLPAGNARWVLLPLLPGVFTGGALDALLDAAARLEPEGILGIAPELAPADRRRIVERAGEQHFEAVFHGPVPAESEIAAAIRARGLAALPGLPEPAGLSARAARDRRLAAALEEAGELWLRLGRSEPIGESLLAASRRLAAEPRDLAALAREGNLGLLEWLSAAARDVIVEESAGDGSALLRELRAAWSGAGPA